MEADSKSEKKGEAGYIVDSGKTGEKNKVPYAVLVALAMGMLVYGVAESYGPVSVVGGILPSK